tara:strand:- start:1723 stop:3438 length:1716 start_codon:yes stop_codon:yes gene_type:complete
MKTTTTQNTSMIYVSHITSNVKKGVKTELGPRTLIVGPNGAGKTSIVNSVELALGGFATDVMGRQATRKAGDLMVLSCDGKTLAAQASLSNGQTASFETAKTRTGAKRPTHVVPAAVAFPFLDVTGNLTGSAAKARTWFLQRIAGEIDLDAVVQCFPKTMQTIYQEKAEALARVRPNDSQVDLLVAIAETAAKKGRSSRADAKILIQTQEEMGERTSDLPCTDKGLARLIQTEAEALEAYRSYSAESGVSPQVVEIARKSAMEAVASLQGAEQEYQEVAAHYNRLDHDTLDGSYHNYKLTEIRRTLIPATALHVELGMSQCLVCEKGSADFTKRHDHLKQANAQAEELFGASDALAKSLDKKENKKLYAESAIQEWQQLKARVVETCPTKSAQLHQVYQSAVDQRTKEQRNREAWTQLNNMKDRIAEQAEVEKAAKKLAKDSQGVIKSLLQSSIAQFESKVQSYLPGDEVFGLDVDMKSDVCRFGLRRDKRLISALSGAEWARVVTAIGCATLNGSEMAVFMPEERAFDPRTLSRVMEALNAAPGQVVLTSTVLPQGENSEWMIIDLSEDE